MRALHLFFLFNLLVFAFQNCGSFKSAGQFQYYTYSSSPDFFYDLKLVETSVDELGRQKYSFDVAMAYVHDINQPASYSVNFSTAKISSVCAAVTGSALATTKHFRVDCLIPTHDSLYVQLLIAGPNGETTSQNYRF